MKRTNKTVKILNSVYCENLDGDTFHTVTPVNAIRKVHLTSDNVEVVKYAFQWYIVPVSMNEFDLTENMVY